jgi:hypothetical protein
MRSSSDGTKSEDLSFEAYDSLSQKCDLKLIEQKFSETHLSDFRGFRYTKLRLCRPGLLVLEYPNMWSQFAFRMINTQEREIYTYELQSAGTRMTKNDGGEQLTDAECNAQHDCTHFRLALLSDVMGKKISMGQISSDAILSITDDDLTTTSQEAAIGIAYFHLGKDAYVLQKDSIRKL